MYINIYAGVGTFKSLCLVVFFAGLEYKFMVKSVDPDHSMFDKIKSPDDVLMSNTHHLHEEETEEGSEEVEENVKEVEEMTTHAPVFIEENGSIPNSTGNVH